MDTHHVSSQYLSLSDIENIINTKKTLDLSTDAQAAITACRTYLDKKMQNQQEPVYGINTGFGSLCDVKISNEAIEELQHNLVQSHACGIGDEVPAHIVRLMLLLKVQSLSYGYSGVRVVTVEHLIHFYNKNILPIVYQLGSLGASGDLAPLAHISLTLIGKGMVLHGGLRMPSLIALKQEGLSPLKLQSKEGLALLNGTQFSLAYATHCCIEANKILAAANRCAALSADAFDCRISPFDERLSAIRPHQGQVNTAKTIRELLAGSELQAKPKTSVQDPYAFRCVPQVHGASHDAIAHVTKIVEVEINAVTDNPNIFHEDDEILSGGNFHAQALALPLDYLAIALSELGSISERRCYQLISGKRELPAFLTANPGLHSGLMITQYTAASIASQNKQYCTPASVDSIVSCNGQEDHVSMAANAATKAYKVVENVWRLLAIEWMTAAQAMEFRRPLRSSETLEKQLAAYRKIVPSLDADRILSTDMIKTVDFLKAWEG